MKKKLLAMLLAVVMAAGLLPTAFAADGDTVPPGSVQVSVKDDEALEALRMPEGTAFTLRNWDVEEGWPSTLTKGKPENLTPEFSFELPLGVTLTINTVGDEYNRILMTNILITAWSDPDRDGVYDQRIAVYGNNRMELLPASEEGPTVAEVYDERFVPAYSDYVDAADIFDTHELEAPGHGMGVWSVPATVQYTSDYLTEYFGANTLLEIRVYAGDDAEDEYYFYHFLLTGEQVDPDLVEGAPDTKPTEPEPTEPETPELPTKFTDVAAGAYYADAVAWAVEKGITSGISNDQFGPNNKCTRAQIVTFLWKAYGEQEPTTTENPFTDVKTSDYYYKAVLWAVEKGITSGIGNDQFGPGNTCTRAQAVTFQYKAAGSPAVSGGSSFTDVSANAYYADAVAWAAANGITSGTGNNQFGSGSNCTRAQVVTFLYKDPVVGA